MGACFRKLKIMYTKINKNNIKLEFHEKWQKNRYFYKKTK